MKYVLPSVIFFALSCKSQKQNVETDGRLQLLIQDGYFPVEHPETQVIEDSKTLKAFYAKVNQTRKPGLPVPDIDFTTHRVLIACMGAVVSESLPEMYISNETVESLFVSVKLPETTNDSSVKGYPFCVYTISNDGKHVVMEIN
jgi:hypothetical protein